MARMPKSGDKGSGNGRLDEILRHLKELRASGKETVRKMSELEKKIEAMREQQKTRETGAGKKETRQR